MFWKRERLTKAQQTNLENFWAAQVQLYQALAAQPVGPINQEYCWVHTPGGWTCPECAAREIAFPWKELVFAQVRGVVLHLDAKCGWEENNHVRNGVDALEVFYGYADECGYQALRNEFDNLGESAYQDFIVYWGSF